MKEFIKSHRALTITLVSVFAVAVFVVAGVAAILPHGSRVAYGVSTDGISLGGMTKDEITKELDGNGFYDGVELTFVDEPNTEVVSGADIELAVDAEATAEKALKMCRSESFFENIKSAVKLRIRGGSIAPVPSVNREKLGEIIYSRGVRKNGEMQDVSAESVSDTEILLKAGTRGQKRNVDEEIATVLLCIENGDCNEIRLPLSIAEPRVIDAETVASMVNVEPQNAEYSLENNELYIKEEVVGVKLADDAIDEKVKLLNSGEDVVITVERVMPEVSASSIKGKIFSEVLSKFTSSYASSSANRAFNVARAAVSINGTILMPGEVFSYNSAIGNPSLANGYKMATVYADGKQKEGVGGGVCQVSSTLYSAVLYADLQIVERRSHSLTVAYVPKGQDATVVYGGQDFKFKNNTDFPIKIEATASKGVCSVRILGTKAVGNKKVEIINSINSTISPTVNETRDTSLPVGTRKVTSSGKTGYNVSSVRVVYENGKEVRRERLTNSSYRMVPTEVTVGAAEPVSTNEPSEPAVKPTEAPAVPTPTPSAEPSSTPSASPSEQLPTDAPLPLSTPDTAVNEQQNNSEVE